LRHDASVATAPRSSEAAIDSMYARSH